MSLESVEQNTVRTNSSTIIKGGGFYRSEQSAKSNSIEVATDIKANEIDFSSANITMITISFSSYADGRLFSLAKQLRNRGFEGILRAKGPMIADQYPFAIRCGFDEVEISDVEAKRQPSCQWNETLKRKEGNYLDRLSCGVA